MDFIMIFDRFLREANPKTIISGGHRHGGEANSNRCHHNGWHHGDHGQTLSMKSFLMNRLSMSLLLSFHLLKNCSSKNYCSSWHQSLAQRCAACGSDGRHRQ